MTAFVVCWAIGWLCATAWATWDECRYRKVPLYEILAMAVLMAALWPIVAVRIEVGRRPPW